MKTETRVLAKSCAFLVTKSVALAGFVALLCAVPAFGQSSTVLTALEAENAVLNGVEVASEVGGFSGTGYVAQFDAAGDYIQFNIAVPRQDYYTLRFRFLNGAGVPAIRTLLLDGVEVPSETRFRNVFDFNGGWLTLDESVRMAAGSHTVTLAFQEQNDQGDLLIDTLLVLDETRPSMTSTRSLLMNNWTDLVAMHHSAQLDPADDTLFGPRLAALHWAGDWPTNQIDGATAYFRDDTAGRTYTELHRFASNLYFTDDGIMHVDYLNYGEEALPVSISKQYAMVPNEPILLARYTLTNRTSDVRAFSLMELLDVNNLSMRVPSGNPGDTAGSAASSSSSSTAGPGAETAASQGQLPPPPPTAAAGQPVGAAWYPEYNAWIADMSATNGVFLVFGAFPLPNQSHQAGMPNAGQQMGQGSAILAQFENQEILQNNPSISAEDVLLAISGNTSLGTGQTTAFTFFYSVQPTFDEAARIADRIRQPGTPADWFEQTRNSWQLWLQSGRSTVSSGDSGVDQAYTRNLIVLRQSQHPEFGSFVASTNPSYDYKVWPRDGTVSALSLDAAGYYEQAEKFWMWMAEVQEEGPGNVAGQQGVDDFPNGTWHTNYSFWRLDEPIDFVQPEWDAVGQFLIGVYHHWRLVNQSDTATAQRFLQSIYPAVIDSAAWIAGNVMPEEEGEFGFGPPGYSVWEEDFEYATYTQVTYASGLNAARLLAQQMGETERADTWLNVAVTIRDNMIQPVTSEPCGGMWDTEQQYFIRGLFPPSEDGSGECEPHTVVDASTDLIWVFGLIPVEDPMAQAHRERILDGLTPPYQLPPEAECAPPDVVVPKDFGLGISRYQGDTFYHTSDFSPGGRCESTVPMPSWPWMSSYMSMAEHWLGMDDLAFARLQWYVSVTGVAFMPTGEAVDWNTQQPLPSTMSQPDDGGYNLQIALLNYLNLFDPRLPPLEQGN